MTEWLSNVVWLAVAVAAFAVVMPDVAPRRRPVAVLALGGILVLLFPIFSISDDLNADSAAREVLAVLFTVVGLIVVFDGALRLSALKPKRFAFASLDSSDPRSPPRG